MNALVNYLCGLRGVAAPSLPLKPAAPSVRERPVEHPIRLAVETALVATATIVTLKLLVPWRPLDQLPYIIPGILIAAALLPAWIEKREFPRIGLDADRLGPALGTVFCVCLYVFPAVLFGLQLLRSLHLPIPLRPAIAQQQNWLTWSLHQFLYVAVAEEVFFRGYVQANTMRLLGRASRLPPTARPYIVVFVSAACFAVAHVVVQGQITSALTFLPGLLMAWLFLRTRTLLAPIVFHGLANISYGIMAATLS